MADIIFKKVPKVLREPLHARGLLHNSPKMTAEEADDAIMEAARTLKLDEKVEIQMTIKDNEDTWNLNPVLTNRVNYDGLYSLLSPLEEEDSTGKFSRLLNKLTGEIAQAHAKAEEERADSDDPTDWLDPDHDNAYDEEEGNSDEESNQSAVTGALSEDQGESYEEDDPYASEGENKQVEENNDAEKSNESTNSEENSSTNDVIETEGLSFPKPTKGASLSSLFRDSASDYVDEPETKENHEEEAPKAEIHEKRVSLIPSTEYLQVDDIYKQIPEDYDASIFEFKNILKNLGYVETPQDDYQRRLNLALETEIAKLKLNQLQSDYIKDLNVLKQKIRSRLSEIYRETNAHTVAVSADEKIKDTLESLKTDATAKQERYVKDGTTRKKNHLTELDNQMKEKIAKYAQELKDKQSKDQAQFSASIDKDVEAYKSLVDKQLLENTEKTRKHAIDKEINDRNNELNKARAEKTTGFLTGVNKLFDEYDNKFSNAIDALKEFAKEESKKIAQEKQHDLELAEQRKNAEEARKQAEAERAEQKRANDLKEKELSIKEKRQSEFPAQIAEAFAKVISEQKKADEERAKVEAEENKKNQPNMPVFPMYPFPVMNNQGSAVVMDPEADREIKELKEEIQRLKTEREKADIKKEKNAEIASLKKEIEKEKRLNFQEKASKRRILVSSLSGIAAILLLGVGTFGYREYLGYQLASPQTVLHQSNSKKNNSKSNTSNKAEQAKPNTNIVKAAEETDNNLKNFQAAKTWQQKVDALNAMLGQHDVRVLKEVNDSKESSGLSRLYQAISTKNEPEIRRIFLYMSPTERKDLSWSARNDVALAFYNIKDWQNGWYARYGF